MRSGAQHSRRCRKHRHVDNGHGTEMQMPLFCSRTALQRLFHHDGERAVAKAAEKFGTMFRRFLPGDGER